jgi:hypothetical protein
MAMTLDVCAYCETEDTEGYPIETQYGPVGLCYDCADALYHASLDDGAAEGE